MFRWTIILVLGASLWPVGGAEHVFDFADDKLNTPPAGFRSVLTGQGAPGDWRVLLDDTPSLFAPVSPKSTFRAKRRVLAQLSRDRTDQRFLLLICENEMLEDFTLKTSFKILEGEKEQMAGLAFRIQDAENYYYIRASALGTNLSFFKVAKGELVERVAANAVIDRGVWYDLEIEGQGNQFRARLNGKELLLVRDTAVLHAYARGRFGFWTKSDSVCYFANTRLGYATREPFAQVLIGDVLRRYPKLLGLRIYTRPAAATTPKVIASTVPEEIGNAGGEAELAAIERDMVYYGKIKGKAHVTLPLHDKNGEPIAAVRVIMKSFPGQTEKNAVVRAMPIIKRMEQRVPTARDLNAHE